MEGGLLGGPGGSSPHITMGGIGFVSGKKNSELLPGTSKLNRGLLI